MDVWANLQFYSGSNHYRIKNAQGLKYYSNLDREIVFQRQVMFCKENWIFITNIVRQIEPPGFDQVYGNFPDKIVEATAGQWNTGPLLAALERLNPRRILINFGASNAMPRISIQVSRIKARYGDWAIHALSTSGAGTRDYNTLIKY